MTLLRCLPSSQRPLFFHERTRCPSCSAPFTSTFGLYSIAEIRRSRPRVRDRVDQFRLYLRDGGLGRLIRIFDMQQFMKNAELGEVVNVIGQGRDLVPEDVQLRHGSK